MSEVRPIGDIKLRPEDLEATGMETTRTQGWNSNKLRAMLTEFNGKTRKKRLICSFSTISLFKFPVRTNIRTILDVIPDALIPGSNTTNGKS